MILEIQLFSQNVSIIFDNYLEFVLIDNENYNA